MAVYVDSFNAQFGRMTMCHMIADSTQELLEMADRIGVQRKWIQDAGIYSEHFDICRSKRTLAVSLGAIEVSWRDLATKLNEKRASALDPPQPGGAA